MKHLRLVVIGALIGLGVSTFFKILSVSSTTCKVPYRHDVLINTSTDSIVTEVAKTPDQLEKGLGGRACISSDQGMLFAFDKADSYQFWMKDMKFPIDMVWVSENKTVNSISPNVLPTSYPKTFTSKSPSKYVLELQANRAQALNITRGTQLRFNL
jgi:uncharacterized membrane protein (UPF0127 family)